MIIFKIHFERRGEMEKKNDTWLKKSFNTILKSCASLLSGLATGTFTGAGIHELSENGMAAFNIGCAVAIVVSIFVFLLLATMSVIRKENP